MKTARSDLNERCGSNTPIDSNNISDYVSVSDAIALSEDYRFNPYRSRCMGKMLKWLVIDAELN